MAEKRFSQGRTASYSQGAPWLFCGRALYQLHLVKAEVAQRFVPPELKLVQAFGYTLGGLYLAHYDASPAGAFDELVVIAGIVWNPPTSCAWAAKVLVNSDEACDHGIKEVGLPSQFATFSQTNCLATTRQPWWDWAAKLPSSWSGNGQPKPTNTGLQNVGLHIDSSGVDSLCHIALPHDTVVESSPSSQKWRGPRINMSLPSFSGKTPLQPELLKYSCDLRCSVRMVHPAVVTDTDRGIVESNRLVGKQDSEREAGVLAILCSKPLLAMHFDNMLMEVQVPSLVSSRPPGPASNLPPALQPAFSNRK